MPRIMTDFLDEAVKTHPNKAAFTEEARSLTYKELQEEAYRIAMPIIKSGFRKKPVALYFDKSIYSGFSSVILPSFPLRKSSIRSRAAFS